MPQPFDHPTKFFTIRMLISTLSVAVAAFAIAAHGKGFGLVGIGRDLFEPKCCYSCLSSFWGLELSCTDTHSNHTKRSGGEAKEPTSPLCHSTNTVFLSSLAYCIKTKCSLEDVSTSTTEQCWNDVAGDGLNVSLLSNYLPTTAPSTQLSYNASILDDVSLVNEQYYNDTRQTIVSYVDQESVHSIYGFVSSSVHHLTAANQDVERSSSLQYLPFVYSYGQFRCLPTLFSIQQWLDRSSTFFESTWRSQLSSGIFTFENFPSALAIFLPG